ncbi:hypothetical protein BDA96_03G351400 [Sorghum bicolor]|uniref:Uncharacterized protein n=1 Tax=Sorghum bicolor TaxID=4558 RepID=A0A921RI38_SORBI|nr:hypothetical protein BDA96_03G351400 [Sorghum bicolor]
MVLLLTVSSSSVSNTSVLVPSLPLPFIGLWYWLQGLLRRAPLRFRLWLLRRSTAKRFSGEAVF